MRVNIMFPGDADVLPTNTLQYITLSGSCRKYQHRRATILLEFEDGSAVPAINEKLTIPDTLGGTDYINGVIIDTEGCATFKVRVLALSSQHNSRKFRFHIQIAIEKGTENVYTSSFRTLSKLSHKRKVDDMNDKLHSTHYLPKNTHLHDGESITDVARLCCMYNSLKDKYIKLEGMFSQTTTEFIKIGTLLANMNYKQTDWSNTEDDLSVLFDTVDDTSEASMTQSDVVSSSPTSDSLQIKPLDESQFDALQSNATTSSEQVLLM